MTNIAVIGGGYVGLVTSIGLSTLGHQVTCIEIDRDKVSSPNNQVMPIYEPGLSTLWRTYCQGGQLKMASDYREALAKAQMVFIAVETPSKKNGEVDTCFVMEAVKRVANDSDGTPILVIRSTVPVGTGQAISQILSPHCGTGPWPVVSNPEFLREGHAISDFLVPDRVVVGSEDEDARDRVAELYQPLTQPIVLTDNSTAELIKYAANAFLSTKISFINEVARLADQVDVNIQQVAEGIGLDQRIGPAYLEAGLGWGDSCFPKDLAALLEMMERKGLPAPLLRSVIEVNTSQIDWVVQKLSDLLVPLCGRTIALWGL
ncbi:MAG: UDP-glucose dehydrogenase family protein, partial [Dehalococcoidia bacterium]